MLSEVQLCSSESRNPVGIEVAEYGHSVENQAGATASSTLEHVESDVVPLLVVDDLGRGIDDAVGHEAEGSVLEVDVEFLSPVEHHQFGIGGLLIHLCPHLYEAAVDVSDRESSKWYCYAALVDGDSDVLVLHVPAVGRGENHVAAACAVFRLGAVALVEAPVAEDGGRGGALAEVHLCLHGGPGECRTEE